MAKSFLHILVLLAAAAIMSGCQGNSKAEYMAEGAKLLSEGNAKGAVVVFKNLLEKYPQDVEARFELAKAYLSIGKPEQAEKEISHLAAILNPPEDLRLVLGKIKLAQAKPDEALVEFQAYLEGHPNSADAWEYLARGYIFKKDMPKAAQAYEKCLSLDPGRSKATLGLIEANLIMGRLTEAESLLVELLRTDPGNQMGLTILAQRQAMEHDIDGAVATYADILTRYPRDMRARYNRSFLLLTTRGASPVVEQDAAQLIKEYPNQAEGYKLQGMLDYSRGAYAPAVNNFQQALRLSPQLENHYLLALAFERIGNLEMAISELRVVLDNAPGFIKARQLLANLNLRLNRVNEAVAELEKLLQYSPDNAMSRRMLGDIFMAKEDYAKSLEMYGSISDDTDQSAVAHLKTGIIKAGQGKNAEAEADLRKAVDLAGDNLESRVVLATFLVRQSRQQEALAVLDIPGQNNKNTALACNAKAGILLQQGRMDDALAQLEKARELDPDLVATYHSLGQLYQLKKDFDKAREQYLQVLARQPKDPAAHTSLAVILEKAGKREEAEEHLTQAAESKQLQAYLNLAGILARENKYPAAITVLDKSLQENNNSLPSLIMKARLLAASGDEAGSQAILSKIEGLNYPTALSERLGLEINAKRWDQAEKLAAKFIDLQPASAESYMPMAGIKELQGDYQGAAEVLRQALAKDKSNIRVRQKLGSLMMTLGKYPEAASCFDEVIATEPNAAMAYAARGLARQLDGKVDAAAKDYESALLLQGNISFALNNLALIYAEKPGRLDKALSHAMAASALDYDNPAILDTLGYVLFKSGRSADALPVLQRAASLAPNDQNIAEHLKMATTPKK